MGGAGTSPPPRRPAATRGAVGARGAYVTCQVSIQVCFEIYSRFETQMFVSSGEVRDLILESLITGMRSGDMTDLPNISRLHSRPQERRLNTGSRLYRAMLAPAAAPPGRPRVFPQAEKTNPGGSNLLW